MINARRRPLCERLIELHEMLDRMLRKGAVEPGHLPLIAGVNAALDALDGMSIEAEMAATRAVFADDSRTVRHTLYREDRAESTVELRPIRAIALAARLIAAALPKLSSRSG